MVSWAVSTFIRGRSGPEDIDHPDELRFDFDPTPGFDFEKVKEAAAGMRTLLEEVGLVGWPKTSGSRGIHHHIRVEPLWDFFQTRRAVLAAGRELERRMDLVTTKWWKSGMGSSSTTTRMPGTSLCSAYGVRPTGYVSTPITWDELADVAIEDFPLGSFAKRYEAVGDLTEGIDESAGRIDTLMEWWPGIKRTVSAARHGRRTIPRCPTSRPESSPPSNVARRRTIEGSLQRVPPAQGPGEDHQPDDEDARQLGHARPPPG